LQVLARFRRIATDQIGLILLAEQVEQPLAALTVDGGAGAR